ncbi:MAG: alpha/beta hydrolase [Proteobacteria bacterium]|nr:alpha/beta hydrolase [Pseudomonadota bacterium]
MADTHQPDIKKFANCEPVSFLSDGFRLKGMLHLPPEDAPPCVIGSHGFLSDGNSPKQIALANHLNQKGIAYFRFDHRGCGTSEGVFKNDMTFVGRSNDLENAILFIKNRPDMGERLGLFGSSMGGASVISVAPRFNPAAIVILAAPVSLSTINTNPENLATLPLSDPSSLETRFDFDLTKTLHHLKNILIFHGEADQVVPASNADEIFRCAQNPKRLIIQQKGDHQMSGVPHQLEFIREATKWFFERLL